MFVRPSNDGPEDWLLAGLSDDGSEDCVFVRRFHNGLKDVRHPQQISPGSKGLLRLRCRGSTRTA